MDTLLTKNTLTFKEAKEQFAGQIRQLSDDLPLAKNRIVRLEVKIEAAQPLDFLSANSSESKIYWAGRGANLEVAGLGIAYALSGTNLIDYDAIFHEFNKYLNSETRHVKFFGGIAFNEKATDKDWQNFGSYRFVLPRFEILRRGSETFFACNIFGNTLTENDIGFIIHHLENLNFSQKQSPSTTAFPKLISRKDQPSNEQWNKKVAKIIPAEGQSADRPAGADKKALKKVVLARRSVFEFSDNLNSLALLRHIKNISPDCFHFCFLFSENNAFIGASPERLYKREKRAIATEAIAGTRPRGGSQASDKKFQDELLSSPKDRREHQLVADFIKEVLNQACSHVEVDNPTALLSLKSGQHLVTSFQGTLKKDTDDALLFKMLHPTPAVGGFPLDKAAKTINRFEPFKRGWYAAPVGWFGFDACEFAVGIRSGLVCENKLFVYAGAGIVEGSVADEEWQEIETKIGAFVKIFESNGK